MKLTPTSSRIYQHLVSTGSISQREAMVEYATGSLTKEITRLRNAGIEINTVRKVHPITGKRYARYFLVKHD